MRLTSLALVLSSFYAFAQTPPEQPVAVEPSPMDRADALYQKRDDAESLKQSVRTYQEICAADSANYEAHWRLARCMYFVGLKETDRKVKQEIYQKGIDAARKAMSLQQGKAEGHFWLGVSYGVFGEATGIMKSLSLVGPIKLEMNTVLKIDPNCEGGGPDRVLGRLYYRLPWIAGGNKKKSLEYLQKSLKLAPANTLTKLYLADTYWSLGQKDKARTELEEILTLQPDPRWLPELASDQKEARRRLDNISKGKKPSEEED